MKRRGEKTGREEGRSRGREYPRRDAVTRVVAATRTMTIPFYFLPPSRSLRLSTFIFPLLFLAQLFLRPPNPHPLMAEGGILKCIPRSSDPFLLFRVLYRISVWFLKGRAPSLFIHRDGHGGPSITGAENSRFFWSLFRVFLNLSSLKLMTI